MHFFDPSQPILRRKQSHLDVQDLQGLIRIRWRIQNLTILSWLYTRIDQVFLLWGWITLVIFWLPQLFPSVNWLYHAMFSSALALLGVAGMVYLSWYWVTVESLRWVIYGWASLMLLGVVLTDIGVFVPNGLILMNLCPLWLGLSGFGYGFTGVGLRSRTFLLAAVLHGAAIWALTWFPNLQFFISGAVTAGCLFMLADLQWDMRPPQSSAVLSAEQQAFNQKQQSLRQQGYQ